MTSLAVGVACGLLMSGCETVSHETVYPECVNEGFVSLFDGQTLLGWSGDRESFAGEYAPVCGSRHGNAFRSDCSALCFTPDASGGEKTISTRKEYGDFVLRFDYEAMGEDAEAAVVLRGAVVPLNFVPKTPNASWRSNWNHVEARRVGKRLWVMLNGFVVRDETCGDAPLSGPISLVGKKGAFKWMNLRVKRVDNGWRADGCPRHNRAPSGFVPLFDGKTLDGWKGVTTRDHYDIPYARETMDAEKKAALQAFADTILREHWTVREGALFFDGKKGGYSAATARDYGDFEMYVDWRTLTVLGDSGLYLRGMSQVQIWDAHNFWHLGSGGIYDNREHERHGMSVADNLVGDWNRFYVRLVGDRLTVRLNGVTVVDDVVFENCWWQEFPGRAFPKTGQIELQCHGDPIEFRNLYIREL